MFSIYHLTKYPLLSTSYLVPGLLLNPVLFLYGLNTILSRVLPPIIVDTSMQPAPYYPRGPSAEHPHLNIHASESLCWSYTAFIVCANLAAFGRVSERKQAGKERTRLKRERLQSQKVKTEVKLMNGNGSHLNGAGTLLGNGFAQKQVEDGTEVGSEPGSRDAAGSEDEYPSTSDSEVML